MNRGRAATAATRVATLTVAVGMAVAVLRAARRRRRAWIALGRYEDRETTWNIVVDRDRTRVYWLCREPARVASALDPAARAVPMDDRWSRWVVPVSGGVDHVLAVEVIGDVPELLIAWRVADEWLPHEGTVRLADAGPDRTELSVSLRYRWAGGEDPVEPWLGRALDRIATAVAA
jgi:uncharacterized membrane protein